MTNSGPFSVFALATTSRFPPTAAAFAISAVHPLCSPSCKLHSLPVHLKSRRYTWRESWQSRHNGSPFRHAGGFVRPAPKLGEHNREILVPMLDEAGYSCLWEAGVIQEPQAAPAYAVAVQQQGA
jgi:hypothetical protein